MGNIFDTHHVYETYHYDPHPYDVNHFGRRSDYHNTDLTYRQWRNTETLDAINQQSLELSSLAIKRAIRDWEEYNNYKDKCLSAKQAKLEKLLIKENKLKRKFLYWCCYSE